MVYLNQADIPYHTILIDSIQLVNISVFSDPSLSKVRTIRLTLHRHTICTFYIYINKECTFQLGLMIEEYRLKSAFYTDLWWFAGQDHTHNITRSRLRILRYKTVVHNWFSATLHTVHATDTTSSYAICWWPTRQCKPDQNWNIFEIRKSGPNQWYRQPVLNLDTVLVCAHNDLK